MVPEPGKPLFEAGSEHNTWMLHTNKMKEQYTWQKLIFKRVIIIDALFYVKEGITKVLNFQDTGFQIRFLLVIDFQDIINILQENCVDCSGFDTLTQSLYGAWGRSEIFSHCFNWVPENFQTLLCRYGVRYQHNKQYKPNLLLVT